jgi:hypothetical protein
VGCVLKTSGVASERKCSGGRVLVAGGIAQKRANAVRCVLNTSGVASERIHTGGRVDETGGVAMQRKRPGCRIIVTTIVE